MKYLPAFALASTALLLPLAAQDATPKPVRRTMTFPTDGSAPDVPKPATPASKPTATVPPKTTPRATPKATEKPTPKPAEKSTPTPAEKAAAKAAAAEAAETALKKTATPAVVTSTVPPEPSQIARAFFGLLAKGDVDGAYEGLMKGSSIAERPEEVRSLKTKTRQAIDIFGTVHGYDLVEIKSVGERLMRTTYLSLGHELPLRWRFYFYKAEEDWRLIDIRVDDKLNGIFDEALEEPPRPEASAPTRP